MDILGQRYAFFKTSIPYKNTFIVLIIKKKFELSQTCHPVKTMVKHVHMLHILLDFKNISYIYF